MISLLVSIIKIGQTLKYHEVLQSVLNILLNFSNMYNFPIFSREFVYHQINLVHYLTTILLMLIFA